MPRKKRRYKKSSSGSLFSGGSVRWILIGGCVLLSIVSTLSFFGQAADIGLSLQEKLNLWFGWGAFLVPFWSALLALLLYDYGCNRYATYSYLGMFSFFSVSLLVLFHLFFPAHRAATEAQLGQGGGLVGFGLQALLVPRISWILTVCVSLSSLVIAGAFLLDIPLARLAENFSHAVKQMSVLFTRSFSFFGKVYRRDEGEGTDEIEEAEERAELKVHGPRVMDADEQGAEGDHFQVITPDYRLHASQGSGETGEDSRYERVETVINPPNDPLLSWEYPPLTLLADQKAPKTDQTHINANAKIIEQTLDSFGIRAKVVEVYLGPSVTQYALEIPQGTSLRKITSLADELALQLAAQNGAVRVIAPIPGRSLVGVEVPNTVIKPVYLKQLLMHPKMQGASPLSIPLGEDVAGEPVIVDIARMPHMLIAGTTGSGKSVLVNAIISTLLFRTSPLKVKLILVDPKRVELTHYNSVPHLLAEVVTDPKRVVNVLEWAVDEMGKRYAHLQAAGVRTIDDLNKKAGFDQFPYIVIIIDEFADIIMTSPKEVEAHVIRLAQLARAAGIHLIIATQRPSVDIITGRIKSNIPCRISFLVAQKVDSQVILDTPGAEALLGKGDMLFLPPDKPKPVRVQGVLITDKEINSLVSFLHSLGIDPQYLPEILEFSTKGNEGIGGDDDPLFEDAVRLVCDEGFASISRLQLRFSIGYNRAAKLMDILERRGVVGGQSGAKRRTVLVHDIRDILSDQGAPTAHESTQNHSGHHSQRSPGSQIPDF